MELTNREVAIAAWVLAFVLFALTHSAVRRSLWRLAVFVMGATRLTIPAVLYWLYLLGIVIVASRLRIWNGSLLLDTGIWMVFGGLPLFGSFTKAGQPRFWRGPILRAIAIPELIAFALELADAPLVAMLIIVPVATLLAVLSEVSRLKPEYQSQKVWYDRGLQLIGIGWVGWTVVQVAGTWSELDWTHLVLTFYLPIWMTAAALPFIYLLSRYSRWEQARLRERWRRRHGRG